MLTVPDVQLMLEVPAHSEPAGYAKVILDYQLKVLPLQHATFITSKGVKRERVQV